MLAPANGTDDLASMWTVAESPVSSVRMKRLVASKWENDFPKKAASSGDCHARRAILRGALSPGILSCFELLRTSPSTPSG